MRRLALLLALTIAAPLRAETVTVMSGEHRGFSRLALSLEVQRSWQLGRDGDGYVLRLDGPAVEIDPDRIFSRIARRRIAAVAIPRPGELHIDLACNCHANAFEERPGLLVVDILDGPPGPGARFEAALPSVTVLPMTARGVSAADDNAIYWRNVLGDDAPAAGTGLEPNIALSLARDELLSRLARAAAQGLVEMDDKAAEEWPSPGSPLLHVQTVLDRDLGAARRDDPPPAAACIADDRVAVGGWAGDAPFSAQIGPARSALLGEFDRPDRAAVTRLVRLYLSYGMGAEARALIGAFPEAVGDRQLLLALAAIMEGLPQQAPRGIFAGQVLCEGKVALWALLADPAPGLLRDIARGAILRGLPDLPPDLRRQIGPELLRRLLERGDNEAAQAVATAMARVRNDPPGPAELLADARLDSATGREAPAALARLAESDDPEAPEALLMLIDARLSKGQPVGPDLVEAAGSLAFERRASALAPRLSRAHILALGSTGAFEAAYAEFDRLPANARLPGLQGELLEQLAATGSDEGFLRHVLRNGGIPADVASDVATSVARRLLDLGFPAEARPLLMRPGMAEGQPLLVARAALADGDPRAALQSLAGQSGPEAEGVRAMALGALGEFASAGRAWQAAGNAEAAQRAAWRAGEWDTVLSGGQPAEQAMAARLAIAAVGSPAGPEGETATASAPLGGANRTPAGSEPLASSAHGEAPDPAATGILARNRVLLSETGKLRADLDALLRLHPQLPE